MATYLSSLLLSIDAGTILQKHNHILKDHTNLDSSHQNKFLDSLHLIDGLIFVKGQKVETRER